MPDPEALRTCRDVRTTDEMRTAGAPAAPPEPDLTPGTQLGHYRLLELLGAGGFGKVWRAEDLKLGREVALKLLAHRGARNPGARALLETEARTVAALEHPGIVTLHALEEEDGHLFLVMECIRGRMLAACIPEGGLALSRVLDLGLQVCDALEAAHRQGVVHRDLNPRNIMITEEGRAKLLDFGLALRHAARLEGSGSPSPSGGGLAGTLPYMSPEQLEGRLLDPRSDLFSLGVVLCEAATGVRPFPGRTPKEAVQAMLTEEPRFPEGISPGLAAVLRRCLEKMPERRFASSLELRQALAELTRPLPDTPAGPSLAILPFRDLSPGQDEDHVCEGLAEELMAVLGRSRELRLAPRSSTFLFKGAALEAQEIGRRLGVGALLCGSVRPEGTRLRVSAELVDVASGFRRWSERYDREREEVLHLQEAIARDLAAALHLTLAPRDHPRPAVDLEAYEDYLRGRQFYHRYNRHGMRFALQMFRQALSREPAYAEAWAGVANASAFLYIYADRSEANREAAEEASARALALDPQLAEAHTSRGAALSAAGRREEAEAAFEEALRLDPTHFEAAYFYARHCFASGQQERAIAFFERAALLDPTDCQAILLVAQVYASLGRPAEAEASRRRGLARAEEHLRHAPDDVRTRYLGANALIALGEREQGLAWARMARSLDPEDPMLLYNLGCIHALAGEPDEALDCLEQAVRSGLTQKGWFLNDGDLADIRPLPRFQALVARLD